MLSYLTAETAFIRGFGTRCLLLFFLCALCRTGAKISAASFQGVSIGLNQGYIIVLGPFFVLLIMASMLMEARSLETARDAIIDEIRSKTKTRFSRLAYGLFVFPSLAAIFFTWEFFHDLVFVTEDCPTFDRMRYLWDFTLKADAAKFCIHDIKDGMPWIYPPYELYINIVFALGSVFISWLLIKSWRHFR